MLAPMQGLTNRALRSVFAETAKPDVLFTEFVRVRRKGDALIANSDFVEALAKAPGVPLVVQVIGSADEGVVEATRDLVARGVEHINVNMGCPFGRMTSVLAGGGMFRYPETVEPLLSQLRAIVPGSLSVKTRLQRSVCRSPSGSRRPFRSRNASRDSVGNARIIAWYPITRSFAK